MIRATEDGDAATMGNRNCERVGLTSVPRVEHVPGRDEVNLLHLMVVAPPHRSAAGMRGCVRLPHLHEILREAKEAGAPVDLVGGAAPSWTDPWSRARRGAILEIEPWQVTVRLDGEAWRLDLRNIQAVRVMESTDAT